MHVCMYLRKKREICSSKYHPHLGRGGGGEAAREGGQNGTHTHTHVGLHVVASFSLHGSQLAACSFTAALPRSHVALMAP